MRNAIHYFDGKNYCGKILEAKERNLNSFKSRDQSSDPPKPSLKNHNTSPPKPRHQSIVYSETIRILNSKYLKTELEKKVKLLNEIYLETTNIKIDSEEGYDLICKVDTTFFIDFSHMTFYEQ